MEAQVRLLAEKIIQQRKSSDSGTRLLVAIGGPPGCGKSSVMVPLLFHLETKLRDAGDDPHQIICVSLDGWHFSRADLDLMSDPVEAHWRRGAAFTFDLARYREFVLNIRDQDCQRAITYFNFDHSVGDPLAVTRPVLPTHRIVIVEGLYTLLDAPGWRECAEMMDLRVWIEVDRDVAMRRVYARNSLAGISADPKRVEQVDMANGEVVRANRVQPTDTIYSIDQC